MTEASRDDTNFHQGAWTEKDIIGVNGSKRGTLAISKGGDLLAVLPDSQCPEFRILRAYKEEQYSRFEEIWRGSGLSSEPLVDTGRLATNNVLSVFACLADDTHAAANIAVLDFEL